MANFEIYDHNDSEKIYRDKNWPMVYILKNDKKIYIGESTNVINRFLTHSKSDEKSILSNKLLIRHERSNKSLAFLIESDLINRAFADGSNEVINTKRQTDAVHNTHDFYGKEGHKDDLKEIWTSLKKIGVFKKDYDEIENEELFKYSPFKEFNSNQNEIIDSVVAHGLNNENAYVNGGAGTGKTLVIIRAALDIALSGTNKRIGIYSAKKGNHHTFSRVFKRLPKHLTKRIIVIKDIKKNDLDKIDYLLIDEAQRLRIRHSFSAPEYFRETDVKNEIEWLNFNNIKYTLFFDYSQKFHKYDLKIEDYVNENTYELISQFRMKAGDEYSTFIKEFLGILPESGKSFDFGDYDLKIFDDTSSLYEKVISENNSKTGMDNKSRMLASLEVDGRKWITKEIFRTKEKAKLMDYSNIEDEFTFGEYKAVWNKFSNYNDWLENSDISEVGCVHTALGRDFRYAGVIFADDIYEDDDGNVVASDSTKNSYYILLTRGIYGHGLYIPNEKMKSRFMRFMKRVK